MTARSRLLLFSSALSALCLLGGPAAAADQAPPSSGSTPSAGDRAVALELVREGNALLDRREAAAALEKFRQAHRRVGGDKLRFNLGQALAELPGREADAYTEFHLFLQRVPGAAPEVTRAAQRERERLRGRVAIVHVTMTPEGAVLRIDGERPVGPEPSVLVMTPGAHRVSARAPDCAPFDETLTVAAGDELTKAISLARATAMPAAAPALVAAAPRSPTPASAEQRATPAGLALSAAPADSPKPPIYQRWWLWTAVGAAAAAGVITAVVLAGGDGTRYTCPTGISCQPLP